MSIRPPSSDAFSERATESFPSEPSLAPAPPAPLLTLWLLLKTCGSFPRVLTPATRAATAGPNSSSTSSSSHSVSSTTSCSTHAATASTYFRPAFPGGSIAARIRADSTACAT